ncbi:MAG: alanine--tRNA ligase [Clostridia bacterium]|nr:alanine--tRNA ligase [Clostridia bacterium]
MKFMYTAKEIRSKFLTFFNQKGHAIIESASVIPENDPTVLFTTAGMHPLVPYLLGEPHPAGKRLTDVQKCIRTGDIDEVGDDTHCTFFEMLGNWSLGDFFKKEAISWSFEFLTSKEWLGLPKDKLYFTVFAGDEDAPRDEEAYNYWREAGVAEDHIFFLPKEHNWWGPAGMTGPCGPDTEMFIDTGKEKCCPECNPSCSCGKYVEIWNDVFMQYNKTADGTFEPLKQKNVDTGMGVERTLVALNGGSVFDTDVYAPIMAKIKELSGMDILNDKENKKASRIVADHIRTATFIIGDRRGVTSSNVDQGYVLRRLIRRAIRYAMKLSMPESSIVKIAETVIDEYAEVYKELVENREKILNELALEEKRFTRTLAQGEKEFEKLIAKGITNIDGESAFHLYDTYGFPLELTVEMAKEKNVTVDTEGFKTFFEKHQALSKAGSEQRFKGGLADHSEETARLHTATHLLHAALRKVLGPQVAQKGSNITAERLRFDFSFERKMTPEEIAEVEKLVNEAIQGHYEVVCEEMTVDEAKAAGAIGLFESKYGERVKVYTMGPVSKEICGGPHAKNTGDLVNFKIKKEESSSAGVRRIKATINN